MIAIDASSATLATIAASPTLACPGVPRSCAIARYAGVERNGGTASSSLRTMRGNSSSVPPIIAAIAK